MHKYSFMLAGSLLLQLHGMSTPTVCEEILTCMAQPGGMVCSIITHGKTNIQNYMSPYGNLHTQHKTCVKSMGVGQEVRLGNTKGWGPPRGPITNQLPLEAFRRGGNFTTHPAKQHLTNTSCVTLSEMQGRKKCICALAHNGGNSRVGEARKNTTKCPASNKKWEKHHNFSLPLRTLKD